MIWAVKHQNNLILPYRCLQKLSSKLPAVSIAALVSGDSNSVPISAGIVVVVLWRQQALKYGERGAKIDTVRTVYRCEWTSFSSWHVHIDSNTILNPEYISAAYHAHNTVPFHWAQSSMYRGFLFILSGRQSFKRLSLYSSNWAYKAQI